MMQLKVAVVVSVALLAVGSWWWIARDVPRGPSEAEATVGVAGARHGRRGDSDDKQKQPSPQSSRTPSSPSPSGSQGRTVSESGAPETENAGLDASRRTEKPSEWREARGGSREFHAQDRGLWSDAEGGVESGEFGQFKQLVDSMRAFFEENPRGSPIDADAAGLFADDVDRLDFDEDGAISPRELGRARRLVERAEHHPVRNDRDDGAYPVERDGYRRPDREFDAIDANRDGLMEVDEYYSFLVDAEKISLLLDANGDGKIGRDESGLSDENFAPLDRDDNGFLMPWEIRKAVARGALR